MGRDIQKLKLRKVDLGICIPTYNRAKILEKNVSNLIKIIHEFNIPIYISDNASTDGTERVVAELMKEYEFIHYCRNKSNLGMEQNLELVLKACKEEYAWFLGDDDTIEQCIDEVMSVLKTEQPDLLVLGESSHIREGAYTDSHQVLSELAYELTWMSGLIIARKMIAKMDFQRYYGTWFPHTGAMMQYLGENEFKLFYLRNKWVKVLTDSVSYSHCILEVYAKGWSEWVLMLPPVFSLEEKLRVLRNRKKKGGMLGFKMMMSLRAKSQLSLRIAKEYYWYLKLFKTMPFVLVLMISVLPQSFCEKARQLYRRVSRKK